MRGRYVDIERSGEPYLQGSFNTRYLAGLGRAQRYTDVSDWNTPYGDEIFDNEYMGALGKPQTYYDLSDWNTPYDDYIFDNRYMGALGVAAGSLAGGALGVLGQAEPKNAIPEVTIYGQCDFTRGARVLAIQKALAAEGVLDLGKVRQLGEEGVFGELTCAAWEAHYGAAPTPDELLRIAMRPSEYCNSTTVPVCPNIARQAGMKASMIALGGLAIAGGLLAVTVLTRRRRTR